jgi:low affinity Fe/Cu permease
MPLNELTALASLAINVILAIVTLTVRASVSEMAAKQQAQRAEDREEMRQWIETRFLSSREADTRLIGLEQRTEDHERRLRRVEQRRNRSIQPE